MAQIDPNAPQPGDPVVFSRFDGLKNTVLPERLGPRDLQRARDVTLDDSGQLARRKGFTQKIATNAHSLFTLDATTSLGVLNGSLGLINGDFSFTALQGGILSDPGKGFSGLQYAQLGTQVYYTSDSESGIVDLDARAVGPWGSDTDLWLSPVVNPTATLPAIAGRLLGKPPNATTLAYYRSRLLLGAGNILWATVPWTYNYVDKTAGFKQFEGRITMIGSVGDGVYVGTDEGLHFLSGEDYPRWKKDKVMDSAVIPGSMVYIPGELGNPPQVPQGADTPLEVSIAFMTTNGFCVASDSGKTVNITENKFWFPQATSAVSMYRRADGMNQVITTLESGGTPVNNAAIGDFLEATIIRGGGPVTVPPPPVTNTVAQVVAMTVQDALTFTYFPGVSGTARITEDGKTRITEDGNTRITE